MFFPYHRSQEGRNQSHYSPISRLYSRWVNHTQYFTVLMLTILYCICCWNNLKLILCLPLEQQQNSTTPDLHLDTCCLVQFVFLLRGERTVNNFQDKGISKGHRQPPHPWDGKEQPFEAQTWHHNSTHSFHNRAGNTTGYLTGPGERYPNWDNNASNTMVRPADPELSYKAVHIQNQNTFISPTEGTFASLQQERATDSLMLPMLRKKMVIRTRSLTWLFPFSTVSMGGLACIATIENSSPHRRDGPPQTAAGAFLTEWWTTSQNPGNGQSSTRGETNCTSTAHLHSSRYPPGKSVRPRGEGTLALIR